MSARSVFLLLALVLSAVLAGCGLESQPEEKPKSIRETLSPRALDDYDFAQAVRVNTVEAYQAYMREHPAGAYARRARYRMEWAAYEQARASQTPGALDSFRKNFPEGWFVVPESAALQRREYEDIKKKESVAAYRAFIEKYKNARSAWTEAATQRLERLLLDAAKSGGNTLELQRYIFDNPDTPYLSEAQKALREARFAEAIRSGREAAWRAFIKEYEGSAEAARMRRHMEEQALAGAERSGRVAALERFLDRYPASVHRERILTAITGMAAQRNGNVRRWVRVQNAEVELSRRRGCRSCKPFLLARGTLVNKDPDFTFDVGLRVELLESEGRCCRTTHWVESLRPGERRLFSFAVRNKSPEEGEPLPEYEFGVAFGSAYRNPRTERGLEIEGLGGKKPRRDRFAPVRVPDIK